MRFRAHETFFVRKGWLYKGIKNVRRKPDIFSDRKNNPTDILGIGTNMVRSLRYWLQVTGLTNEVNTGGRHQELTDFARIIWENDRYMEEMGTLWLIHYKLATQKENATTWYYFFNEFNMQEFDKNDFINTIRLYTQINNVNVADSSLEGDFDCLINTYLNKNKMSNEKQNPEENISCPLNELHLIDIIDKKKKTYKKMSPQKGLLHPLIVLAVIVDNAKDCEIKISSILNDKKNAGKIFNLDIILLTDILYELQKLNYIQVNRTAGLDVVILTQKMTFDQVVEQYYENLRQ